MKLNDVVNRAIREALGSRLLSKPALVATGAAATFAVTSSPAGGLRYCVDGKCPDVKADVTVEPLTANAALQYPITGTNGFYTAPAGVTTTFYFLIVIDASGNYKAIQGTYLNQTFTAFRNALGTGALPDIAVNNTYVPIGWIKVVNTTNAFVPGTTLWNAAGVTTTTGDLLGVLPSVNP